ncbi:MAG: LptE family protein [Planctomycetes bacterium]|nr:LptE family protein [Planctomycetota bacterium]
MAGLSPLRCLVWAAAALVPCTGGCGYRTGFDRLPGVRTLAVPVFENRTEPYRREVEVDLTVAVVRELQARTPYSVVDRPEEADAVLLGELVGFTETPLVVDRSDRVVETSLGLTVRLTLVEVATGRTYFEGRVVSDAETVRVSRGENLDLARREALREIAERVVFELEMGWE